MTTELKLKLINDIDTIKQLCYEADVDYIVDYLDDLESDISSIQGV